MDPNGQNNTGTSRDQGKRGQVAAGGCSTTRTMRQPHVLLRSDSGKCDGLFVNVVIGMWGLAMLVVAGSVVTIFQKQLYDKCFVNADVNPDPVRSTLITVTGESANFYGKVAVDFKIGDLDFTHDVYLADIQSDGILGLDFLSKYECNILLGQRFFENREGESSMLLKQ